MRTEERSHGEGNHAQRSSKRRAAAGPERAGLRITGARVLHMQRAGRAREPAVTVEAKMPAEMASAGDGSLETAREQGVVQGALRQKA